MGSVKPKTTKKVKFTPEIEAALADDTAPVRSAEPRSKVEARFATPQTPKKKLILYIAHYIGNIGEGKPVFFGVRSREMFHFVEQVLDSLPDNPKRLSAEDIREKLITKAREVYSPVEKRAGEVFTDEEMEKVQKEYHDYHHKTPKEQMSDKDYSYGDYNQKQLGVCIAYWEASKFPQQASKEKLTKYQSWEECPLIRYPFASVEALTSRITAAMQLPKVLQKVEEWNQERSKS